MAHQSGQPADTACRRAEWGRSGPSTSFKAIAPLADLLEGACPVAKMLFSACTPEVMSTLQSSGRRSVILCGVETHVCVMQSALDLVENGFQVFVPQDAVSSRYESDKRIGLERMRSVGAVPCSSEMVVFELLREAGTPDFKALLPFIK
jgi:isochorismate hydrolase